LIRHFTKKAKFSNIDLFFPKQLLFIARYKVPWILKWSYRITKDTRVFARQFSVKWWDKFEVDRIAKYVYNDPPEDPIPRQRQRPAPWPTRFDLPSREKENPSRITGNCPPVDHSSLPNG
ncbi:unnamed protein product, partial [Prunus brigantina]